MKMNKRKELNGKQNLGTINNNRIRGTLTLSNTNKNSSMTCEEENKTDNDNDNKDECEFDQTVTMNNTKVMNGASENQSFFSKKKNEDSEKHCNLNGSSNVAGHKFHPISHPSAINKSNNYESESHENQEMVVIGICGGSGSGKTSIAKAVMERVNELYESELCDKSDVALITHDCYYRDLTMQPFEVRKAYNFDHPGSLETELLIEHVQELKAGRQIGVPLYDFTKHTRKKEREVIKPPRVLLLEGILLFQNSELRNLIDIKIFVDTDKDVRFIRRLRRDVVERGRTMEDVCNQYLETVRPMHEEFVEPTKRFADLIIPEGGFDSYVAIATIESLIQKSLNIAIMNQKRSLDVSKVDQGKEKKFKANLSLFA